MNNGPVYSIKNTCKKRENNQTAELDGGFALISLLITNAVG